MQLVSTYKTVIESVTCSLLLWDQKINNLHTCVANYAILQSYHNTILKNRTVLKFLVLLSTTVYLISEHPYKTSKLYSDQLKIKNRVLFTKMFT